MNNRILFLVDHKHRDLPSISLISYFLNNMNVEAKVVALTEEDEIIDTFNPSFIVLPKPNYDFEKLIRWKLQGRKVIVMDSEGNPQAKDFIYKYKVRPDLYIFWSELSQSKYPELSDGLNTTTVKTLGFYRSDFLGKELTDLFPSKDETLEKYGLNKSQKTITLATATQDSHFSDDRLALKEKRRSNSLQEATAYKDIVKNMRKLRSLTESVIEYITENYPAVNLVIKPHPNENVVYWHELISKLNNKNIVLFAGEPINHLLKISDLHIAHNVCTTTTEALLFGLPTVEIHTDMTHEIFEEEHLYATDYTIKNPKDILALIDSLLFGKDKNGIEKFSNDYSFSDYIDHYYHKYDNMRCFEYAKYLSKYIKQPVSHRRSLRRFLYEAKNIFLYYLVFLRNRFSPSHRKQAKTNKEINRVNVSNERPVIKVSDTYVDQEYGLLDNRMILGDETYWYERFDDNDHIKNLLKNIGYKE